MGKTIASVFTARPTTSATMSMPVRWKDLSSIFPTDFTILNGFDIVKKSDDYWKDTLQNKQEIHEILKDISKNT
jgi:bifunctional non-homologous end joining protein LigD